MEELLSMDMQKWSKPKDDENRIHDDLVGSSR